MNGDRGITVSALVVVLIAAVVAFGYLWYDLQTNEPEVSETRALIATGDPARCQEGSDLDVQYSCIRETMLRARNYNASFCSGFSNDVSVWNRSFSFNVPVDGVRAPLPPESVGLRDNCLLQVALATRDDGVCSQVESEPAREKCQEYVVIHRAR